MKYRYKPRYESKKYQEAVGASMCMEDVVQE